MSNDAAAPTSTTDLRGHDAAEVCHLKGWTVGTRLIGDAGQGPTVIEITAIGERLVLAKAISRDGQPTNEREGTWTLSARNWQEAQ